MRGVEFFADVAVIRCEDKAARELCGKSFDPPQHRRADFSLVASRERRGDLLHQLCDFCSGERAILEAECAVAFDHVAFQPLTTRPFQKVRGEGVDEFV